MIGTGRQAKSHVNSFQQCLKAVANGENILGWWRSLKFQTGLIPQVMYAGFPGGNRKNCHTNVTLMTLGRNNKVSKCHRF